MKVICTRGNPIYPNVSKVIFRRKKLDIYGKDGSKVSHIYDNIHAIVELQPNAQPSDPKGKGSQQSKADCKHEHPEYLAGNAIVGVIHRSTIEIDGVPMPIQRWCPDCGAIQIDTIKRDIRKSYPLHHGYKWIQRKELKGLLEGALGIIKESE